MLRPNGLASLITEGSSKENRPEGARLLPTQVSEHQRVVMGNEEVKCMQNRTRYSFHELALHVFVYEEILTQSLFWRD